MDQWRSRIYIPSICLLLYHFYDVVTGQKNLFLDFSVSGGANLYAGYDQ